MKKFIAVLLIALSIATPALADNATGVAAGLVALNMLFGGNRMTPEQKQQYNKLKAFAKQNSDTLCTTYAVLAVHEGEKKAVDTLGEKFRAENYMVSVEEIDLNVTTITIADRDNTVISEVDVAQDLSKVTTTTKIPSYGISEKSELDFTNKDDIKKKMNYSMYHSAGFEISETVKSDTDSWIITQVKPDSEAEKMGLLPGSEIFGIDKVEAKVTPSYMVALYVENCAARRSPFKVTFADAEGKPKTVSITPK